ncbi:energy transducer TonB [Orenia marismortui]|uniref:TonB family protein n=1 Tax=Orenia marismortui TaxID=46469 RepID=A0A4R8H0T4_9FIRM|nr:energy transducer TonB [Orenia marismortui]TDX52997.1 TonB family protein [Orenia marismortui]
MKLIERIKGKLSPLTLSFIIALGIHLSLFNLIPELSLGKDLATGRKKASPKVSFEATTLKITKSKDTKKESEVKEVKEMADNKEQEKKDQKVVEEKERISQEEKIEEKNDLTEDEVQEVKKEKSEDKKIKKSHLEVEKKEELKEVSKVKEKSERKEEVKQDRNKEITKKKRVVKEFPKEKKVEKEQVSKEEQIKVVAEKVKTKGKKATKNKINAEKNMKTKKRKNPVDLTQSKVAKGIVLPKLTNYQQPIYPASMRRREIEGKVILKVLLDQQGSVKKIKVERSSGYQKLDQAAVEAVGKWKFSPTKKEGKEVEALVLIPVNFRLN